MAKRGPQGNVGGGAQKKKCSQMSLMTYFKPAQANQSTPSTSSTVVTPGYYESISTLKQISVVQWGFKGILEPTGMIKHTKFVQIRPLEHILGVKLLSKALYTPRGPFTKHTYLNCRRRSFKE